MTTVRAAYCDHRETDARIAEVLDNITAPLEDSWKRLEKAGKVLIKTNMVYSPESIAYYEGRRRELVDDSVMRGVLSLLKERTDAELCVADTTWAPPGQRPGPELNFRNLLEEFGVRYIDASEAAVEWFDVPGGGLMFDRYQLHREIGEADAFVSVAKLKSHLYTGLTGCAKNLFGLLPLPPVGKDRDYYHHIIRLPYVIADLGMIIRPCLNIIDGLVGQSGREWDGEGRVCNTLIAGDNPITTDACAGTLMGHDVGTDWPFPPFRRDRNHLLAAAERRFGTVNMDAIDFQSDVPPPVGDFDSEIIDSPKTILAWRRSMCEQALYYRDNREPFLSEYTGSFVFIQDGKPVWSGNDLSGIGNRRELAGSRKESSLWLKYVDPDEFEGERYERYEENLDMIGESYG